MKSLPTLASVTSTVNRERSRKQAAVPTKQSHQVPVLSDPLLRRSGEMTIEHFRRIYLSMQSGSEREHLPVIGVTSAREGEGRTTIATGMAAAMAADLDTPIVLVEADLAHPGVHQILGVAPEPGLCEFLRGECELATAIRQISERFFVIPAGNAKGEGTRLLRQLTTTDLRSRFAQSGALMVLDLPPILTYSYGVLAATMADTLTFVVRAGQTTDAQVRDALSRLDDTTVRGIVLNGSQSQLPKWLAGRA